MVQSWVWITWIFTKLYDSGFQYSVFLCALWYTLPSNLNYTEPFSAQTMYIVLAIATV